MNALSRKGIELQLIAELRRVPATARITAHELRRRIADALGECAAAELSAAVRALRYQGKLQWNRLALAPSMLPDPAGSGCAAGAAAPPSRPSGAALYEQLRAEGERRGLKPTRVSIQAFGNGVQMTIMRQAAGPVRPRTLAKAEAWLGEVGLADAGLADGGQAGQAPAGPDDPEPEPEPYPGEVNDSEGGDGRPTVRPEAAAPIARLAQPPEPSRSRFAAKVERGRLHASATRAAARPLPAPKHESEVERRVREEVNDAGDRRRRARSSTAARVPLELRKFGVPDLSLAEGVTSLLAEEPGDLMRAIGRKHAELWRRVVLLGRATGQRPAQCLYAALEAGVAAIEQDQLEEHRDAA